MPRTLRTPPGRRGVQPALALMLLVAGCDGSTAPQSGSPVQFSRDISFPDLESRLEAGAARVDIRFLPGGLTARKVAVREAHGLSRPEEIRGRVSAISLTGDQATVTFEVGGLKVAFGSSTRFRPRGVGHGGDKSVAQFVARVQADLDAGRHPAVRALRSPPAEPQGPEDASFTASELKLDHEADHPRLQLNVAAANLVANPTPPPDGWLEVFGLKIELRASDGATQLAAELPVVEGAREFAGVVRSVDPAAGTVTLDGGTVVQLVAGTEIEAASGDAEHLASLADVHAALAAGRSLTVEGAGLVDSTGPLTLTAVAIEFKSEDR